MGYKMKTLCQNQAGHRTRACRPSMGWTERQKDHKLELILGLLGAEQAEGQLGQYETLTQIKKH